MWTDFYIYMYLDKDNIPFYIGKGRGQRYLVVNHIKQKSSSYLEHKVKKIGKKNIKIHFLHKNLTEEQAFFWERYWIKYIGRKCTGEGTLCNVSEGGIEGIKKVTRGKHKEETKHKISESLKGHKYSKESLQKMSDSHLGQRKGNRLLPETKLKISKRLTGHIVTEETRTKIRNSLKGIRGR